MKKIIMFKGGVETLEFFSARLRQSFEKRGFDVFTFDLDDQFNSFTKLIMFCEKSEAVLVTFNFIGLSGETIFQNKQSGLFFDSYDIKCINIVVDHPFYYHKNLKCLPKKYIQCCIDRTHIEYMKRFFPNVNMGPFLPLAGTEIQRECGRTPINKRDKIDIIFTGNYTPPNHFDSQINRLGKEYSDFYHGIIDDLIANTDQTMNDVFEKHIKKDIPDISDNDLILCMENMIFIDLYVRFYMREKVVTSLVDNGFKVHVFGCGLDSVKYKHPENLIMNGGVKSDVCLHKLCQSKISLNVMPWFKDGAHDRIFNAALNGAVNLTDGSIYLNDIFQGKEAVSFYSLDDIESVPQKAEELLRNQDKIQFLSDNAYKIVSKGHTWDKRADILCTLI